jgi:hypothetical protein
MASYYYIMGTECITEMINPFHRGKIDIATAHIKRGSGDFLQTRIT